MISKSTTGGDVKQAYLAIATDEETTLGGVDTEAGERVDFDLLHSTNHIVQQTKPLCSHDTIRTICDKNKDPKVRQPAVLVLPVIQPAEHPSNLPKHNHTSPAPLLHHRILRMRILGCSEGIKREFCSPGRILGCLEGLLAGAWLAVSLSATVGVRLGICRIMGVC